MSAGMDGILALNAAADVLRQKMVVDQRQVVPPPPSRHPTMDLFPRHVVAGGNMHVVVDIMLHI